jgi:hypothetical protein
MGLKRWLVVGAVVAACGGADDGGGDDGGGGGGTGTGTVSGTIGGRSITVANAISSNYDYNIGNTLHYGVVLLGEPASLCDLAASHTAPGDAAVLGFTATVLSTSGGNYVGTLPTVGTYVVNGQSGNVVFGELNAAASCDVVGTMAQTGTVTLTSASDGVYAGSFDIVFETGDHVTGTFDPAACPALTQPELGCTP